jgi:hypothetical protein
MADVNPEAVQAARKSGYSDDEIVAFLSEKNPDQFKAAANAGYSSKEVLDHIATPKDTGYAGALQQGLSDVVSGVGKTIKNYVSPGAGETVEALGEKQAPKNYKPATEDFMKRGAPWYDFNWSSAPRTIAENAPALATDVLAGLVAKKLGGKAAGAVASGASYLTRTRGDAAESRAAERTGDASAAPNTEDKVIAAAAGIPEAALAALGASRFINPAKVASTGIRGVAEAGGKLAATGGIETGVGAAQDVIGQAANTVDTPGGLRVDPKQALGSGLINGMTGTGLASVKAGADVNTARRFRNFDTEASQRVANASRQRRRRPGQRKGRPQGCWRY